MAVNLILLNDVADLGKIGDQVHVSDGYARNYLLPRKLAAVATPAILKQIEAKKLKLQQEHAERVAVAQTMAEKLAKISVVIKVEAGEDDKLFGAVTVNQLLEAVKEQGMELDRNAIVLEDAIRELGSRDVEVKLHPEVRGILKVKVVRKDDANA